MIGMNCGKPLLPAHNIFITSSRLLTTLPIGNSSAAESPFGGIKESGYGKESGKDVAVAEYLITKTGTMMLEDHY
jgi:acyl-CoA reductase-like NAD-dependent aldehyde dehydrogenase